MMQNNTVAVEFLSILIEKIKSGDMVIEHIKSEPDYIEVNRIDGWIRRIPMGRISISAVAVTPEAQRITNTVIK